MPAKVQAPPAGDVKIRCRGAALMRLNELTPLQGNLKSLDKTRFEKLKASLLTEGFCFPFHVWQHEGKNYFIDGHQRDRVLKALAKDPGYSLPTEYPVAFIDAEDHKQAARLILLENSQYGEMDNETLYEFMHENQIELSEIQAIEVPRINLKVLELGYFSTNPAVTDPTAELTGMPEYTQNDKRAFRSLIVHFKNQGAVDEFAEGFGQTITEKTRFIWFPKIEIETYSDKRYSSES